ncbi:uncharacterized protein LOC103478781 [Poecilia reticulata]|uniref:uncharacterized protein LOC103478781 n=1 Tax=Poecilia reticulata TaxID=8081 RepID=UPI0004A4DF1C|nr:PREDICTED: uncharacterized protein LOC103478781 [Poecilia reticulata]
MRNGSIVFSFFKMILRSVWRKMKHNPQQQSLSSVRPASSCSSDSTIILKSSKNSKKELGKHGREEAKQKVRTALRSNPKGEEIMSEYNKTKTLSDATRRQMVNILVADMIESHGRIPPISVRTSYALGILTLFPYLQDPYSKNGYEHFYDPEANTGYLAWRLKTVQQNTFDGAHGSPKQNFPDGPTTERGSLLVSGQLFGEECVEALSVIRHSTDESVIKEKMRATFEYRQKMVHDPDATSSVLDIFSRFHDTPGLIDQDFSMMLGDEVSGRFLSKSSSYFKPKVIAESQSLPSTPSVEELRASFDPEPSNHCGWDSDLAALLLLLHLLPPTSRGHKKQQRLAQHRQPIV